jgi:hypothetical protein
MVELIPYLLFEVAADPAKKVVKNFPKGKKKFQRSDSKKVM